MIAARRHFGRLAALALALGLAACDDPAGPAPVAEIALSAPAAAVTMGQTLQITAVIRDEDGNVLAGRTVTWSSASDAIARVSAGGLVTGVAPGAVVITARSEGEESQFTVTVLQVPVATVAVNPDTATVPVGTARQLTATARDAGGGALTGRTVAWSSSDTTVAVVNGSGLVTARRPGSATVTATVEGRSGTSRITTVPGPVAGITVSPQNPSVRVGATIQLTAETRDASGAVVAGRVVTWTSSDPGKATVNGAGVVTGVDAGSATITATSEGRSATTLVTVLRMPVAGVRFVPFLTDALIVGDTLRIRAVALDSLGRDLPDRVVAFAGNNDAAATVSSTGHLSAVGAGSVVVTATSEGRTVSGTVNVADYFVSMGGCSGQSVKVGATCTATATIRNLAGGNVIPGRVPANIVSSNPGVASTSSPTYNASSTSVVVTGVSAGSVTLTGSYVGANGITRTGTAPLQVVP